MVKTKIELLRIVKQRNITYLKIKMRPCSGLGPQAMAYLA